MRIFLGIFVMVCVTTCSILGLRGMKSTKPPIYVFPDMDFQDKYKTQGRNEFFPDGRNDRPVPAGVVMRGNTLNEAKVFDGAYEYDPALRPVVYTGKNADGSFYDGLPMPLTHDFLARGREKYTIYCSVCHSALGDGNGVTKSYGMVATPSYYDQRLRDMPNGEIFNTITHGKNTMMGYGDKLVPEDRWAVVAYVRALQLAANGRVEDVPAQYRSTLGL
jgi:cytochrome c553